MKILSLVEATTMNAVAKGTLEFYGAIRELKELDGLVAGSVLTFDRSFDQNEPNEFVRTFRASGIEVEVIPERRRFDLSVIPALRNIVEARRPDIVVTNSIKSHFLMWRSRLWQKYPWAAFHHGYTTTDRKMRLYNRLDRWSLPKADRVLTVCHAFAQELAGITGLPVEKIVVLHNAIRPSPAADAAEIVEIKERYSLAETDQIILSVGRLSKEKAHIDLIRAFEKLCADKPDLRVCLLIVGDGPEREALRAAVKASKCSERIVFIGHVGDIQPFYSIADVFALPSHSEGSPNVLLEAMAANVPVVATAVGGVPEIVENETSALLVPANHPAAMALAISRLLNDRSLADRLTNVASVLIRRNHSPELYARLLIGLYREIATQHRT